MGKGVEERGNDVDVDVGAVVGKEMDAAEAAVAGIEEGMIGDGGAENVVGGVRSSSVEGRAECIRDVGPLLLADVVALSLTLRVCSRYACSLLVVPLLCGLDSHPEVDRSLTMPWNVTVSSAQSRRKKRYWFRMLWLAKK